MEGNTLTIAVTGINNTDNPGPGIPVIRALRESDSLKLRIIGLAYENLEPGIYMEGMIDKTYKIPYPSKGVETYVERLIEIHEKEELDLIIPNLDAELFTFMKAESKLLHAGIKTFLPTFDQFEERHKANLPDFGKKYGIKVPKSKAVTGLQDLQNISDDFDFPVLVKGKFYDAYVAYSPEQVQTSFHKVSAKWGLPVIIQEFVKGTEVNVVALGDGNGNTMAAVPMRKQFITEKGKAWSGITLSDHHMLQITKDLISKTKWRGGMELEMIKTSGGDYYMIEINPRIPAWVYLAVGAGQNIPEALVKLAIGMPVKPMNQYKVGKMFIRYSWDLLGDIQDFEHLSVFGEIEK
jgi:carbamoyl-phosphate synthase large subunit